ncbi:MAG: hypothetical protein JRG83_12990 [Deltaproteobacteria bacterium]|nr:hypothetical protein [Deltaproteobacteria bacterium]
MFEEFRELGFVDPGESDQCHLRRTVVLGVVEDVGVALHEPLAIVETHAQDEVFSLGAQTREEFLANLEGGGVVGSVFFRAGEPQGDATDGGPVDAALSARH